MSTETSAYPDWAADLPKHLVAAEFEGRPVIRYVHMDGIFWDSACGMCQGRTEIVKIFPNHEPGLNCSASRESHCTCDSCF